MDKTKVAIDYYQEVTQAILTGTKVNHLGLLWIDLERPLCSLLHYTYF